MSKIKSNSNQTDFNYVYNLTVAATDNCDIELIDNRSKYNEYLKGHKM